MNLFCNYHFQTGQNPCTVPFHIQGAFTLPIFILGVSPLRWTIEFFRIFYLTPAILTSEDFIRSNEIIRTKWPIYVVIGHFVLTI